MTITLFEKRRCRGDSAVLRRNVADLKDIGVNRPGSIRMTSDNDEVLLFKNDDWRGGVLYLRGRQTIENLGSARQGGRHTFGNSVRSARVTPFWVDLNVSVVTNDAGDLPGNWTTEAGARADIASIIGDVNAFLRAQQALLTVRIARVTFRRSERHFALGRNQPVPARWKERREIDTIFVNRFRKEGVLGVGAFPCFGKTIKISAMLNPESGPDQQNSLADMAYITVHEIGHYLGLQHSSAGGNDGNLMFPSLQDNLMDQVLTRDQIREMHQRLSRNISRRGDRDG